MAVTLVVSHVGESIEVLDKSVMVISAKHTHTYTHQDYRQRSPKKRSLHYIQDNPIEEQKAELLTSSMWGKVYEQEVRRKSQRETRNNTNILAPVSLCHQQKIDLRP